MRTATTLIALLWAGVASAQGLNNMDPFWFHAADVALLQAKEVQAEIKLNAAQRAKMNQFADAHRAKIDKIVKEYEAKKKTAAEAQQDPRLVGYFIELKKNVMAQLSKVQLKRLGEISLQNLGLASLMDEKVGARVGLTKDQIAKMRAAFQDGGRKYAAAEKVAADPILKKYENKQVKTQKEAEAMQKQFNTEMSAAMKKAMPKLQAIQKETEKKMLGIMNAKQQATYKALVGKPFKPA